MKKLMKSILIMSLTTALILTGCAPAPQPEAPAPAAPAEKIAIGITQIVEHPSLDLIRQGVIDGLKDKGFVDGEQIAIDYVNAQGNMENTQLIAQKFEADKKKLVIAITTPSGQAAKNNVKSSPIIFSAVTDPEGAGLVGDNITGVSDMTPIDQQLELLKTLLPTAKTIGMIYNSSEQNSVVQVELTKEKAIAMGLTVEAVAITTANEIPLALDALLSKVDVLYTHVDNTLASAYGVIIQKANEKKIPVLGAVEDYVKQGAIATQGIDNYKVGYQTGVMAARVLSGEDVNTIPFETLKETDLIINTKALADLGITVSDDLKAKAKTIE